MDAVARTELITGLQCAALYLLLPPPSILSTRGAQRHVERLFDPLFGRGSWGSCGNDGDIVSVAAYFRVFRR